MTILTPHHTDTDNARQPLTSSDLFYQFGLWYGKQWTEPLKNRSWAGALQAQWDQVLAQLSPEECQRVMNYLGSPHNTDYVAFPPKPLQFLQLPRQIQRESLPNASACYQAAIAGQWDLHPIVKPIAEACGIYWLRTQATDREGRARFAEHYREVVRRFLDNQPLDLRPELPAASRKANATPSPTSPTGATTRTHGAKKPKLTAFQTIHQRADRMIATPGVMEKIRAAKTAKEKMAICRALWDQYKREDEAAAD